MISSTRSKDLLRYHKQIKEVGEARFKSEAYTKILELAGPGNSDDILAVTFNGITPVNARRFLAPQMSEAGLSGPRGAVADERPGGA